MLIYIVIFILNWFSISGVSNELVINTNLGLKGERAKLISFLSLSIGYIIIFTLFGLLNTVSHLIGYEINKILPLLFISILFYISQYKRVKTLTLDLSLDFKYIYLNVFKNFRLDLLSSLLILVISIQLMCLLLRLLLPMTHTDQISQYFYDSLQISRLNELSLIDYYKIGQRFRTDSLASFFDAFSIQLTNSWMIPRLTRGISLILSLSISVQILNTLSKLNYKKILLIIALILSLPDIWDIGLSGKHDMYICLFELTGFSLATLSFRAKEYNQKITLLLTAFIIGVISIFTRLSSISYAITSFLFIIYYLYNFRDLISYNKSYRKTVFIVGIFSILLIILLASIGIINYIFLDNPFYILSPPNVMSDLFPNALFQRNYEHFKYFFNIQVKIPLINNIISIFYAGMGIEPIRFALSKAENIYPLNIIFNLLNNIGPRAAMVSFLSLSPMMFIPLTRLKSYLKKDYSIGLLYLIIWIFIWSCGITYTRVIISCNICFCIYALKEDLLVERNYFKLTKISIIRNLIYVYSLITIFSFTIWSFSTLWSLPIDKLISSFKNYDRASLTREYILLQNKIYNSDRDIPTKAFEKNWESLNLINHEKIKLLKNTPPQFAYFINDGLIIENNISKNYKLVIGNQFECFEVVEEQDIQRISCNPNNKL